MVLHQFDDIAEHEPDHSEVTPRELSGWYSIGVATEGFSGLATAVFFPLIIQSLAAQVAFKQGDRNAPCDFTNPNGYTCDVNFFGWWVDTAAFVLYSTSLSVVIQFFLFLTLGSWADYGNWRKRLMLIFGIACSLIGIALVFVLNPTMYWLATLIYVFSNAVYGAVFIFCYAYIPILTRFSSKVIEARSQGLAREEILNISDKISNEISAKGFLWGYVSSVSQLLIGCGFVFVFPSGAPWGLPTTYTMQIAIAAVCAFQMFVFLFFTVPRLKERPGPPLPAGKGYIQTSLSSLWSTLKNSPQLTELFKFLLAWFLYSDSYTTVVSMAILFVQSVLGAETLIILAGAIIVPLFAGVGNWVWLKIQLRFQWSTKKTLMIQAFMYTLLPLWGLVGFFTPKGSIGLNNKYEILALGAYHGFLLGATQSTCRVLFGELIPHGRKAFLNIDEAQFFGLYEITDKGSSWVGPLIVAAITSATGNIRYSFIFLFAQFLLSITVFVWIDMDKGREQAREFIMHDNMHQLVTTEPQEKEEGKETD